MGAVKWSLPVGSFGVTGQPLASKPPGPEYELTPHSSGILATNLEASLQTAGNGFALHIAPGGFERVTGHMVEFTAVTPKGAKTNPAGQKTGERTTIKYAACEPHLAASRGDWVHALATNPLPDSIVVTGGATGQPLTSNGPAGLEYMFDPQKSGMLAIFTDAALQAAGTGNGLQLWAGAGLGKGTGHMVVPTTVTPIGANVDPRGQNRGVSSVMKYAA